MAYTAPSSNNVIFELVGGGYTPTPGDSVVFLFSSDQQILYASGLDITTLSDESTSNIRVLDTIQELLNSSENLNSSLFEYCSNQDSTQILDVGNSVLEYFVSIIDTNQANSSIINGISYNITSDSTLVISDTSSGTPLYNIIISIYDLISILDESTDIPQYNTGLHEEFYSQENNTRIVFYDLPIAKTINRISIKLSDKSIIILHNK